MTISMLYRLILNKARFCFQMPKTSQITLIWRERGFFAEKYILYFVSTVFSKIVGFGIFWNDHLKLFNGIKMHVGVLHALDSINSKLWKWLVLIDAHIQHQNWHFWRLPWIFPNKIQKIILIKYYFSITSASKWRKHKSWIWSR